MSFRTNIPIGVVLETTPQEKKYCKSEFKKEKKYIMKRDNSEFAFHNNKKELLKARLK